MRYLTLLSICILFLAQTVRAEDQFTVVCLHDVIDTLPGERSESNSTANLAAYLRWLHNNGYNPVSIDDVIAAQTGKRPLPPRAIMLTFDDGYESFYSRVFPLLKAYGYPAVFALVGSWMSVPPGGLVQYGDGEIPRERLLSWDQVREMVASGLIEIASHSFDMHRGIVGNPNGSPQPAMTTRRYDADNGTYEDEESHRRRIKADLAAASDLIERKTGKRPRVMVWPYGAYNGLAVQIANELGMPFTMTLDPGVNNASGDLSRIGRLLVSQDPPLDEFVSQIRNPADDVRRRTIRLRLDDVYDPDPAQQGRNLDALVSRVYRYGVTNVILQAYSDPNQTGVARELYFPNRHLPMRADLFSYVSWQLETRANANVYAWLPVFGFDFSKGSGGTVRSHEWPSQAPAIVSRSRVSPADANSLQRIRQTYEDLAAYTHFDGLAFLEDASGIGLNEGDPAFTDFTDELVETVTRYRAPQLTMGGIIVRGERALESSGEMSRTLLAVADAYDTATLILDSATRQTDFTPLLSDLARLIAQHPADPSHTLVELPVVPADDGDRRAISETLRRQMHMLVRLGVSSFGYFPDDYQNDHPMAGLVRGALSAQTYPYIR